MLSRTVRSVAGWLPRLSRLSWFYVLGLLIAIAALFAFAKLADEVLEGETRAVNTAVLEYLHAHANPALDALALTLTYLGGVAGSVVVGGAAIALLLWRRRPLDAIVLALVLLGGLVLVGVLKAVFRQPRPDLFPSLAPKHTYSFPSGHALLSFCLYGYLTAILVLENTRWRWWAAAALGLLPVGISWSRLYLGVHWLSDVVAGALVAVFWVSCCVIVRQLALGRLSSRDGMSPLSHGPPPAPGAR